MMIVGPTGAGKSVLLGLLALQFRRYAGAQVYIFDKGFSARATVLAMGGAHHALGLGGTSEGAGAIAFQPLRSIDRADERAWAAAWRSEEHTSELQSRMRISYDVFCLKKKTHPPVLRYPHIH